MRKVVELTSDETESVLLMIEEKVSRGITKASSKGNISLDDQLNERKDHKLLRILHTKLKKS